jgi:aspartyl protease family protein
MAISSGTRAFVGEAASWIVAAGLVAGALVYFSELKALSLSLLGVAGSDEVAAVKAAEPVATPAAKAHGEVEIRASDSGHYHAEAEINGRRVPVLVDTGATMVALTYEDAETAGIFLRPSDFTRAVTTANGVARVAPVMLDRVSVGGIMVRNVAGTVSERGKLSTTLLGMSFLSRLERVDMRGGVLLLED